VELKGWPIDRPELGEKVGSNSLWLDFAWINWADFKMSPAIQKLNDDEDSDIIDSTNP